MRVQRLGQSFAKLQSYFRGQQSFPVRQFMLAQLKLPLATAMRAARRPPAPAATSPRPSRYYPYHLSAASLQRRAWDLREIQLVLLMLAPPRSPLRLASKSPLCASA